MKPLIALAAGLLSSGALFGQSFFTPTPTFLAPAWRESPGTEFSHWDVFYSPHNGFNYPDMVAPNGAGGTASEAGFAAPAKANPGDPFAFWHLANPTLQQVLQPGAFIIGPGVTGNIYSPNGLTGYELADAAPYTLGTVVMQWQTDGQLIDFSTLRLVATGGEEIAPTNFITEYRSSGSTFGGLTNRTAAQWNLTGLNLTAYTLKFASESSSTSFQELQLDTAPAYVEAVPSARTWAGTSGNWSVGANWSGAGVGPVGGNITFAGGSGVTIDGGAREIGQLTLTAPGAFEIGASGGGALKVNTGIVAHPASSAAYTISAPYQLGSFNLFDLGAGAEVTLAGSVTSTTGFYKFGAGTLRLHGPTTLGGAVTIDDGALEIGGSTAVGTVSVANGAELRVDGSLGGSGSLLLNGGVVSGKGNIQRQFTLDTDDVLSPGAGVGTLQTVAQTWAGGGRLRFELSDAEASAGSGWDLVNISGTLSFTATTAAKFTLELRTLGLADDFHAAENYLWKFASATALSGFSADAFQVDATNFLNPYDGTFSVVRTGNELFLQYSSIPEPAAFLLLLTGAALSLRRRRPIVRN